MSGFHEPEIPREQIALWSRLLDDALPADHPVRLLDELLGSAAFAPVFSAWERRYDLTEGKPPYHPRSLAMLYIYGLLNRLRSSRQLEAACHNRIDMIWLMSGQHPDHSTIAQFVTDHKRQLGELFRQVVHVGIKADLIKMEHHAVDGTNVEANAGRGSVHREQKIREQEAAVEAMIADLERQFESNERRDGLLTDGDTPWTPPSDAPGQERAARLKDKRARLKRALASIERRREDQGPNASEDPKPIASTTDPDSRVMKDKEGRRKPNYNAQLAVDTGAGMVVATEVNDQTNDQGQMLPMLAAIEDECGAVAKETSFDSGYNTGRDLATAQEMGLNLLVDDKRDPGATPEVQEALRAIGEGGALSLAQIGVLPRDPLSKLLHRCCFIYNAAEDTYRCPAGQTMRPFRAGLRHDREGPIKRTRYKTDACGSCPLAAACCKHPKKGREVNRGEFEGFRERMRAKMAGEEARSRYRLRGRTVEPRIGVIKSVLGLRKFLRRGNEKVRDEWRWACTALNVGILIRHWSIVKEVLG